MIRAVLFDRDDTLTVTDPGVYRAAGEWIAGRYGVEAREAGRGLAAHWQQHSDRWWGLRSVLGRPVMTTLRQAAE